MNSSLVGHNSAEFGITVEVRLFNGLAKFLPKTHGKPTLEFSPGSAVADVMRRMGIPESKVFLVLANNRDVTPGCIGGKLHVDYELMEGDIIALSGPVPYSWGYGAPVV